jgi:hypothetical protein
MPVMDAHKISGWQITTREQVEVTGRAENLKFWRAGRRLDSQGASFPVFLFPFRGCDSGSPQFIAPSIISTSG